MFGIKNKFIYLQCNLLLALRYLVNSKNTNKNPLTSVVAVNGFLNLKLLWQNTTKN